MNASKEAMWGTEMGMMPSAPLQTVIFSTTAEAETEFPPDLIKKVHFQ